MYKNSIKMIAFDLDGTILTDDKILTQGTKDILIKAADMGVQLVPATGRSFRGIPDEILSLSGCHYAITANGAAIYSVTDDSIVEETPMDKDRTMALINELIVLDVMPDPFIDGKCYMLSEKKHLIDKMNINDATKEYIRTSRTYIDDMDKFLSSPSVRIQKITINFPSDENGIPIDKDKAEDIIKGYPEFVAVTGGIENIELTSLKATKGSALISLAKKLGIEKSHIVAYGDSGNDADMLEASGLGVAMKGAEKSAIDAADQITLSNENDGVAVSLRELFGI